MCKRGIVAGLVAFCVFSACDGLRDETDGMVTQDRPVYSGKMDDCSRFPARC